MDIDQVRALRERVEQEFGEHPSFSSVGISPDRHLHVSLYGIEPELEMQIIALTGPAVKFHTVERVRVTHS